MIGAVDKRSPPTSETQLRYPPESLLVLRTDASYGSLRFFGKLQCCTFVPLGQNLLLQHKTVICFEKKLIFPRWESDV